MAAARPCSASASERAFFGTVQPHSRSLSPIARRPRWSCRVSGSSRLAQTEYQPSVSSSAALSPPAMAAMHRTICEEAAEGGSPSTTRRSTGLAPRTISRMYRASSCERTAAALKVDAGGKAALPKQRCWHASFHTIHRYCRRVQPSAGPPAPCSAPTRLASSSCSCLQPTGAALMTPEAPTAKSNETARSLVTECAGVRAWRALSHRARGCGRPPVAAAIILSVRRPLDVEGGVNEGCAGAPNLSAAPRC